MAVVPISPVFRATFMIPGMALETIMTCKVFRKIILGHIKETQPDLSPQELPLTTIMPTLNETSMSGLWREFSSH